MASAPYIRSKGGENNTTTQILGPAEEKTVTQETLQRDAGEPS